MKVEVILIEPWHFTLFEPCLDTIENFHLKK